MTIGEQIKYFREKKGISQAALADEVGLSSRHEIYRFESGIRNPKQAVLKKIAEALDCELIIELVPKPLLK